jgi:hypothetical protein
MVGQSRLAVILWVDIIRYCIHSVIYSVAGCHTIASGGNGGGTSTLHPGIPGPGSLTSATPVESLSRYVVIVRIFSGRTGLDRQRGQHDVEHGDRAGLVQWLVAVAAFG